MEPQRPTIILITGRQRSHLLFMMGYSALSGLLILVGGPGDSLVLREMDAVVRALWSGSLAASGLLALAGCFWRGNLQRALALERAGMLFNTMAMVAFAALAYEHSGSRAYFAGGICLAWAAANVYRAAQISKDLRNLRGAQNGATA